MDDERPSAVIPFPRDPPLLGLSQRLPPVNLEAEQALLGALLANNKAYERVSEFLAPEHFADPIHGRVFAAIQRRVEAGQLADAVTLRAEFEHSGILDEVGGTAYLAQLLVAMVGIINAGEYGRVILDCWQRRRLIDIGETLVNRAFAPDGCDAPALGRDSAADLARLDAAPKPRPLWHSGEPWDEAEIPRRAWLAHGFILRRSVALIAGAGSAGKSMLVKGWLVACALGLPLGRFNPCEAMRVLSYNVEDDLDEERRRLSATLRQFNRSPSDIAPNLRLLGPTDIGTLVERDAQTGKLRLTNALVELIQHIETFRPDVVFLDPLVELHTVEENDNTGLRSVLAQFRALAIRFGIAIVILHHVRKGVIAPGDPDGIRGAGSIVGAGRSVFTLCVMSEEDATTLGIRKENRRNYFRLDGAKMNYAPCEEAEWFERVVHTLGNGEDVAAAQPWTPPKDVLTADILDAMKLLVSKGMHGDAYTLRGGSQRSVAALCKREGIATEAGIRQVCAALAAAGFVEVDYKRPNRVPALGLRSPDGQPADVRWL